MNGLTRRLVTLTLGTAMTGLLTGCEHDSPRILQCQPMVSGLSIGEWIGQGPTKVIAKQQWRHAARDVYGSSYDDWGTSRNSDISCTHDKHTWTCTAKAEPCRYP
jgi:hypothetical protein